MVAELKFHSHSSGNLHFSDSLLFISLNNFIICRTKINTSCSSIYNSIGHEPPKYVSKMKQIIFTAFRSFSLRFDPGFIGHSSPNHELTKNAHARCKNTRIENHAVCIFQERRDIVTSVSLNIFPLLQFRFFSVSK